MHQILLVHQYGTNMCSGKFKNFSKTVSKWCSLFYLTTIFNPNLIKTLLNFQTQYKQKLEI